MAFSLQRFIRSKQPFSRLSSSLTRLGSTSAKVALCGGGISNCVAANYLAQHGIEAHIFEAGRGVGGRSATRRIGEYYFDHGAQVIDNPKSVEFIELMKSWQNKQWIKTWEGSFGRGVVDQGTLKVSTDETHHERYVAVPAMNSLCKNLASHELIHCHFETKAIPVLASKSDNKVAWKIQDNEYDWVVVSDRSIGASILKEHADDRTAVGILKNSFVDPLQRVFSPVPVLTMMLTLPGRFPKSFFPFDSLTLSNHPSISLISRETSKPDRERLDSKECWIIHSTSELANTVMCEVAAMPDDNTISFEERKQRVNDKSLKLLRKEFINVMQTVCVSALADGPNSGRGNITEDIVERILSGAEIIKTHRWSAAFPSLSEPLENVLDKYNYVEAGGSNSYVDSQLHFAACGDYLPHDTQVFGRIEGAAISGLAAAKGILRCLQKK